MRHLDSLAQTNHGLCQLALHPQNFFWWAQVVVEVSPPTQSIRVAMAVVVVLHVEYSQL
jgi:hypothetical protein